MSKPILAVPPGVLVGPSLKAAQAEYIVIVTESWQDIKVIQPTLETSEITVSGNETLACMVAAFESTDRSQNGSGALRIFAAAFIYNLNQLMQSKKTSQ